MSVWNLEALAPRIDTTVLVTGATSGLGLGVAEAVAPRGADLVLAARDAERGEAVVQAIRSRHPEARVRFVRVDLSDLDSVRECAARIRDELPRIDVLLNNAGVMMPPRRELSPQGHELQFATNHLGHFALTAELFPLLQRAPAARVVSVSSVVAKLPFAKIDFDDLDCSRRYISVAAYAQSKLANAVFARELHERLERERSPVISVAAHPGYTATQLTRHVGVFGSVTNTLLAQKLEMGILPLLRASFDAEVRGGEYYGPRQLMEYRGHPVLCPLPSPAEDAELRERLFTVSEELVGRRFDLA